MLTEWPETYYHVSTNVLTTTDSHDDGSVTVLIDMEDGDLYTVGVLYLAGGHWYYQLRATDHPQVIHDRALMQMIARDYNKKKL